MIINNSSDIYSVKNFILDDECDLIINKMEFLNNAGQLKYNRALGRKVSYNPTWPELHHIFFKYNKKIKEQIKERYGLSEDIYPTLMYLSTYEQGEFQVDHIDDEFPWIHFSSLIYLNDFEGGEICFPQLNYRYKPGKKELIIWPSEGPKGNHSVSTVLSEKRYTILFCYTLDKTKTLNMVERENIDG